jgi:DNA mismatch repair protein MutH
MKRSLWWACRCVVYEFGRPVKRARRWADLLLGVTIGVQVAAATSEDVQAVGVRLPTKPKNKLGDAG